MKILANILATLAFLSTATSLYAGGDRTGINKVPDGPVKVEKE